MVGLHFICSDGQNCREEKKQLFWQPLIPQISLLSLLQVHLRSQQICEGTNVIIREEKVGSHNHGNLLHHP